MKRIIQLFLVAIVACGLFATSASAAVDFNTESANPRFMGSNFSMNSAGWKGKNSLLKAAAKDDAVCGSFLYNAGVMSRAQVARMTNQEIGGTLHRRCWENLRELLKNYTFKSVPIARTAVWKKAKCKRTARTCVLRIEGRNSRGRHVAKRQRVKRTARTVVAVQHRAVQLPWGPWVSIARWGVGMNGCLNKPRTLQERFRGLKLRLKVRYKRPARPERKPPVAGPTGTGSTEPGTAEPPATTPPGNGSPTEPPPNQPNPVEDPPGNSSPPAGNGGTCNDPASCG